MPLGPAVFAANVGARPRWLCKASLQTHIMIDGGGVMQHLMHQPFGEFSVAHFVLLIPSGASRQEVGVISLPIRVVLLCTLHECLLIVLHFCTRHPAQRAAHPREIDGTCVVPGLVRRLTVAEFRQMPVERRTVGDTPRLAQQLCQLSARIVLIRIGEQFGTGRKIVFSDLSSV